MTTSTELAEKFEKMNSEFTRAVESSSNADWSANCSESWSFGVTAHHVAQSHAGISMLAQVMATGAAMPPMSADGLNEMNAKHASDHANCTKEETTALLRENGGSAAKMVRGLSDEQLAKEGTFLGETMTAQQFIENVLIHHVAGHLESMKAGVAG